MHILFLTDNFPPETNAPASRTFEHCRDWVRLGHRVTVITCAPNFPKGKVFPGYRNLPWQKEKVEGIDVIRVWSYITENEGFVRRILDYVSFMITAIPAGLSVRRPDIVIGTSPQFFTAVAAWVVAGLKRRPFVFELRDIWPESIRAVQAMKTTRVLDRLEKLELFLYRKAKLIVSVTYGFRDNLGQRGVDTRKIEVVRNGVDLEQFHPRPKDEELMQQLDLAGRFTVGYIGTHGMAHALGAVLEAAQLLQGRLGGNSPQFLLVGHGAEKDSLVKRAKELGLQNTTFIDNQPRSEIARYWSVLDATVIHLRNTPLFATVIPSKMFECIALGIPILHGVRGESALLVEEVEVGITFESENAEDLANKIEALAADPQLRNRLSQNGKNRASQFSRAGLAAEMLGFLVTASAPEIQRNGSS